MTDLTERILDAARTLVLQGGARRLSLTDVAAVAGVSRPTLYRYFVSKEELLDALGKQEYHRFNTTMAAATAGKAGAQRLEAAIEVVTSFLADQPPRRLVDLEPGFVNEQMAQVLPMLTAALATVLDPRADKAVLAAAIARTALSHYIFPDPEAGAVRRQLRAVAGLAC